VRRTSFKVQFYHRLAINKLERIIVLCSLLERSYADDTDRGDGLMYTDRLDRRHRNKNGRIAQIYGNTYIRTLRVKYGVEFAPGERSEHKLIDVLHQLDSQSLGRLIDVLSRHQTL
jgi:hypothetical protein